MIRQQAMAVLPDGTVMIKRGNQIGPGKKNILKEHERINRKDAIKAAKKEARNG